MNTLVPAPTRRPLRALAALIGTSLFTAGIPVLLVRVVGWPLPHGVPGPAGIISALQSGWRPDPATVIKAFTVVAWIAWAQIGLSVASEVRSRQSGRRTQDVPLARWCRPLGDWCLSRG